MKHISSFLLVFTLSVFISCTNSSETKNINPPDSESGFISSSSLKSWEDAKFSMFIHWGIYSIPAGVWNGKEIGDYAEQIKGVAEIPTGEYRQLVKQFNPGLWDPDSIALLAKEAGMKSIVITSKHHDGFNMFGTEYSTFNVVDATPYQRDVVKDLSEACQRHGLKFGVYFSTIDWDYPGAAPFEDITNNDVIPWEHHQYNMNQVEELMTKYGEISEIWFDMGSPSYEQSKEIRDQVKRYQPNCAVSGRLWNNQGDFVVMGDNVRPEFKMGVPWQTPASIFEETWGYRSWMERTDLSEKIREKINDLINVVSMGGNYLLNIGPRGDGSVVEYEEKVLLGIGKWLKVNGEAIYATRESEIDKPDWGYITTKDNKLYFHIIDYPEDNKLVVEGLELNPLQAYPLSDFSIDIKTVSTESGLSLELPIVMEKDDYATVIVLEYSDYTYFPSKSIQIKDEQTILTVSNGEKYHGFSGPNYTGYEPTVVKIRWNLKGGSKERYKLSLRYNQNDIKEELLLVVNGNDFVIETENDAVDFLTEIQLNEEQPNWLELSYNKPDNPYKELNLDELSISIE